MEPGLTSAVPPSGDAGIGRVAKRADKTFSKIEETQAALRESIETAKELAEQSERLIQKHKKEIGKDG